MASFEDAYDMGELLGTGAFAETFLCTAKPHGVKYAVKIIKNAEPNVQVEVDILRSLEHINIVRLINVYQEGTTISMVQELMNGGEMFDYIVDTGTYSEADACRAFGMMLEGLQYLHSQGILHRDLKPENILLTEKSEKAIVKIADFGLAKVISEQGMTQTTCGTPGYVAPEVLRRRDYDTKVDIWAAGVILYIMVSGYEPFYDANETQMFKNIMAGKFSFPDDLFSTVSPAIVEFIKRVLVTNPEKRPSAEECLQDPWLKEHTDAQKTKELTIAKANITKLQAKKKFKGALIAVRLGAAAGRKYSIPRSSSSSSGSEPKKDERVVVDLEKLANEMDAAEITDAEIVKDVPVEEAKAEAEAVPAAEAAPAEELPGQVPE